MQKTDLKSENERLMVLLAHAVKSADGWHDDCHGGQIQDDELIAEARALVAPNRKSSG